MRLDQTSLSADVRVDYFVTPSLSLQIYAQPLVSSGRYADFKELARARSRDFTHYDLSGPPAFALPSPDFNLRSIRGNAVLRWEYVPGTVAYLVWTQDRSNEISDGAFELHDSLASLGR